MTRGPALSLRNELQGWLQSRVPPRALGEAGRAALFERLLEALLRHAPEDGAGAWWARLRVVLGEGVRGTGWPSEADIAQAAKAVAVAPMGAGTAPDRWRPNLVRVEAERMRRGEPVGEYWCDGRGAELMLRAGVSAGELAPYRAGLARLRERLGVRA